MKNIHQRLQQETEETAFGTKIGGRMGLWGTTYFPYNIHLHSIQAVVKCIRITSAELAISADVVSKNKHNFWADTVRLMLHESGYNPMELDLNSYRGKCQQTENACFNYNMNAYLISQKLLNRNTFNIESVRTSKPYL